MSTPASIDESSVNVNSIGSVGNFDNTVNEANNVEVSESPINVKDDEVEENPFAAKKRKRTSKVWDEFKKVTLLDGTKKAERWNATYYMLQSTLDLKDVFPRYQLRDSNYHYLPSEEDWSKVQTVCTFLEELHYVTNVISGC
ncbi:zinc finger BED domain-containing protein RICESLEEPER 4-like [Dioscorea cayenensis subsp. rotundata]|uniref:Zinc finger BED domain-containing protein RICESLEEPER 4-like n=1 Tax=Dioscorea cayennensis subsp. rotundata TaxID=55577 RepID=A0AB40C387_DIOCR|nr:zinc finger BED domain-containing protein RICESLEEPER 4-like [Dioscorea cayenensis subsp. rotundata]